MTQSFVRLAILHEGDDERVCGRLCRFGHDATDASWCGLSGRQRAVVVPWERGAAYLRTSQCLRATTQQALDAAVVEAAEAYIGTQGPAFRSTGNEGRLAKAVDARRSATREGGT